MQSIPESFEGSQALQLITQQGMSWKIGTLPNIVLANCPYCKKEDHCYMEIHGSNDPQKARDGLHLCQRCGKSNNLFALRAHLGLTNPQLSSQKEWAASERKIDPLPDVDACHETLMQDIDVLDYLINFRGFSRAIIVKQKIGIKDKHYFKETGPVKALVYPYLVNGNAVWCHYRTCPDIKDLTKVAKAFSSPAGWDAVLYNQEILKEGLKEVVFVEGEANCISAMDHGINDICGVPGANMKRAEWIDSLDKLNLEKIYLCYDRDKTGQRAAQTLASRIGIEKCWKITLPDFTITPEDGTPRQGKDLNEFFRAGHTAEEFEQLKQAAVLFDVDGVASASSAVDEFIEELDNKGAGLKYSWPPIKHLVQFDEGDCIDLSATEKTGKSTVGLVIMEYMVNTYGESGVIICLEMTRAKLARKWVSHLAGIPDNLPKTPEEAKELTAAFKNAIPTVKSVAANREGDLLFCYPHYKTADDIYKLIIDCIRRYGVRWIMLDNIQRLCDTTIGNRNRTQYLSEISKTLSQITKDYKVQMIRILQPHRIAQGKIISTDSTDGSSQIAKDCDAMITLHRQKLGDMTKDELDKNGFIETDKSYAPEMLVSVGLSRYSAGGSTMLYFDGATSSVYSMAEGKVKEMNAQANANVGYANQLESKNLQDVIAVPESDAVVI